MINNSLFKVGQPPNFHPIIDKYERIDWWRDQKRKIFEGYWVGGKWMPGDLYYYINFHNIVVEYGAYRGLGLPWLRDIDWEKFYVVTEATGFSGFTLDTNVSCHRELKSLLDGKVTREDIVRDVCTDPTTGKIDYSIYNNIFREDGTPKKYENAREYMRKEHLMCFGKPLYFNQAKHVLEVSSRGYGKDLEENTLLHTESGTVKIKDICVGDRIFGDDGKLTTVISKDCYYDQEQYRVTFEDHKSIICGGGHLWGVTNRYGKKLTVSINDIKDRYKKFRKDGGVDYNFFIPIAKPVQYPEKQLPIDPYFLGLWIGDGNSIRPGITTDDSEIVDYLYGYAKELKLNICIDQNKDKTRPTCLLTNGNIGGKKNALLDKLRNLNLLSNKHIPEIYLHSSEDQRMELLRGMMDSDGHVGLGGNIDFSTSSDKIINGFIKLIDSLGIRNNYRTRITKCNNKDFISYRVSIMTSKPIFKLSRKLSRIDVDPSNYSTSNRNKVAIENIEPIGVMNSVCIGVDNESKLFIAGDRFIVTHNSYSGSGLIAYNYITDGARDYDLYIRLIEEKTPLKSETLVGAIDSKYGDDLLNKVKVAFENYPDSHVIQNGKDFVRYPSPLSREFTGSFMSGKSIIANSSKSQIHHRTFQDNPIAANGTRPNRAYLDEIGFMINLPETWEAIESTQASAQFKRLMMYGMGTGGLTSGGAAMYTHEIFYAPEEYGCLSFEDDYEGKGKIGYFVPATHALNKYKEGDDKITNVERALADIEEERAAAKKSPTRTKLMATIINKPLVPSEIFLRMEGTFFPIQDLKMRLAELESAGSILGATYKYDMNLVGGKVTPSLSEKPVIREFPLRKGLDMDGCIEVFELPKRDNNGVVFANRYLAGWDPVVNDGNENTDRSLQSMFILDSWTDRLVAEYTARTYLADEYYEQARRLLIYFNAQCNYESNIKGPYAYFKNKNSLHLLVETPEILKDRNLLKGSSIGNSAYGTNTNDAIIGWALRLTLTWMEADAYGRDTGIRNMNTILSPGLLKEAISYSRDINTDRISALGMVMILKENRFRMTELAKGGSVKSKTKDPFWDKAFGPKNSIKNSIQRAIEMNKTIDNFYG